MGTATFANAEHASRHAADGADPIAPADIGAAAAVPTGAATASGWDAHWRAAKAVATAGTGTAKIAFVGDSVTAGQSGGTITDALTYGYIGQLAAMLQGSSGDNLGAYAEGYTIAGLQPGTGTLTAPSSPYGAPGSYQVYDGGIGQMWAASVTGTNWLTITVPAHPVTGASPTSVDLFTIDFNTNQWSYKVDGGTATTITCAGNGTLGSGILRRTSIPLTGTAPHTIVLSNVSPNGLMFVGHVAYYGTSGVGIMRDGIPGFKAVDFATGGGATASSNGGASATPDHIKPWSGQNDSYNTSGSGFPWAPDLAVIMLGGNDVSYGSARGAFEKTITRMIHAFRRGQPASAGNMGCSILLVDEGYPSEYSDNFGAVDASAYEAQQIKGILQRLAATYGCAFLDLGALFGETPVARGLAVSGNIHPTQNGAGAGGGDGHLLIAQAIHSLL